MLLNPALPQGRINVHFKRTVEYLQKLIARDAMLYGWPAYSVLLLFYCRLLLYRSCTDKLCIICNYLQSHLLYVNSFYCSMNNWSPDLAYVVSFAFYFAVFIFTQTLLLVHRFCCLHTSNIKLSINYCRLLLGHGFGICYQLVCTLHLLLACLYSAFATGLLVFCICYWLVCTLHLLLACLYSAFATGLLVFCICY